MRRVGLWVVGSLVLGLASFAGAGSGEAIPIALEQRLLQMEKRIQQLEQENAWLKAQHAGSEQVPAATPLQLLREELGQLDQKVRVLERLRENEQEAATEKAKTVPVVGAGPDGFFLKSAQGDFNLKLKGLIQADGRFLLDEPDDWDADTFAIGRLRPSAEGTLWNNYDFKVQLDLKDSKSELLDAYLDVRYWPEFKLRVGKFKTPFGLERLQSPGNLMFFERGMPTKLVPNRDLGVQLFGDLLEGSLSYALAVVNGVPDGGSGDKDSNDDKDVVAYLFSHPFKNTELEVLKGLGVGLAAGYGQQEGTLPSYKTSAQQTFFSFEKGVQADGKRMRLSPQAYYYYGPFGFLTEYARSSQKVGQGAMDETLDMEAWQVAASYVLTGEEASYRGVKPRRPFDLKKGTWGAFELAARYGELLVDDDAFEYGFADPDKSAEEADAWTLGLNWYLNKNVKTTLNYEQTTFDGGAPDGDRDDEKAVLSRLQFAF